MGSCTITISEEAYQALLSLKQKNETLSDVIMRITEKRPLTEVAGIMSEEETDRIEKSIKELREKSRIKFQNQIGMIPGAPPKISKDEIWKEFIKEKE
jgi:predicted CopG family antitoxin